MKRICIAMGILLFALGEALAREEGIGAHGSPTPRPYTEPGPPRPTTLPSAKPPLLPALPPARINERQPTLPGFERQQPQPRPTPTRPPLDNDRIRR
ncbi:hypothetical protein [Pseudomonas lopnurensis]|uniref:hypothetical protein n=1 Tax=Pseudomonas lopnurensis TaxID=1477517 RepID=UPI00187AE257|nr:hypothetical protein [Pseudomonas lopnurensis]MBE7377149.1 hypothetical protein [Pseudomonas lopnurensis]